MDFVDRFREAGGAHDYDWEARWVRDEGIARIMLPAISALFGKARVSGDAMDYFLVPTAITGVPQMLAKKVGIEPEAVAPPLISGMGHRGAAQPLDLPPDGFGN